MPSFFPAHCSPALLLAGVSPVVTTDGTPLRSIFKTGAFNRSAIPPRGRIYTAFLIPGRGAKSLGAVVSIQILVFDILLYYMIQLAV
jgi:hypothetical protein